MRVAIVGSRHFTDYDKMCESFDDFCSYSKCDVECVISGGASGADTLAERFAKDRGFKMVVHRALWNTFGKSAGVIRNREIVNDCDVLFAFWDGKSSGTKSTIDLAKKAGKRVFVTYFE